MINELDVTLTDYGLAIECALLAWLLVRRGREPSFLRAWFGLFFVAISAASLAGGTVHGFFPQPGMLAFRILWPLTLLAIGLAAVAAWMAGLGIRRSPMTARSAGPWLLLVFLVYAAVVLFVSQQYLVAIIGYLPAAVFLLFVFSAAFRRTMEPSVLAGVVGLALTFVAAGIQLAGVGLHPRYFDHNALYHLVQAVALYLVYRSARWFVQRQA
ncbi:MAG: hypothetical protein ACE5HV_07680 [Acidobacteriota bacterium]